MFSKLILLTIALGFSLPSAAMHYSVEGSLLVRNANNDFLDPLDVELFLPKGAESDIYLDVKGRTYVTNKSKIISRSGRKIFYIVFEKASQEIGEEATAGFAGDFPRVVFKGTYARGNNLALYYGDLFVQAHGHKNASIEELVASLESSNQDLGFRFNYFGAFKFMEEIDE